MSARPAASTLLVALFASAAAAGFTLRSEVDARRLGVQDEVELTITVEGSGAPDEIPMPALTNLDLVAGPAQSTQVSIVNGRMSQSRTLTYTLRPRTTGRAEVGAVSASGQTAPAIVLEVVPGSVRPAPRRRADPFRDPFGGNPFGDPFEEAMGRSRRGAEPKLFMEAVPSRTRLHVGEPLVLTYYLYTQTSVTDLQMKDAPQYGGFWAEDLERPQPGPQGESASAGGETYQRFPLIRKLLFPTKAGVLTLAPASFRISLARQSFFDPGGVVERATRPVAITVDPVPEASGFSGAVGRFSTSAALDHASVPVGEAATLRFRLDGTGNLKWIDQGPEVKAQGASVYPPQAKSELRTTPQGITGSRTWEYVVVPQTAGTVEIPPLPFSYFDPAEGRIITVETAPLSLRAEGGTAAVGLPAPAATTGRAAGGPLPLRTELDRPGHAPALSGRLLVVLLGLTLLLHAGLLAAGRVPAMAGRGGGGGGRTRSARAALRDLERAGSDGLSKEQAAALVEKALHEAFGALDERDDSERARVVRTLLDDVQFVRYAPQLGDYSETIRDLAARGAATVRRWA
ncbi:MAG TPA: BatD family protein [Vicinamibacteria bacterium]|nr:BatD family protein [Vicinamibacteria bacterium]